MRNARFSRLAHLALLGLGGSLVAACADEAPVGPTGDPDPGPSGPAFSQAATSPGGGHVVAVKGRLAADFEQTVEALGGSVVHSLPGIGVVVTAGLTDADAARLASEPGVASVDRDMMVQWIPAGETLQGGRLEGPMSESDQSSAQFFLPYQWNLRQIDADDAWTRSAQGAGVVVAVLDTGVDPFHIDLDGKIDGASTSMLSPGSSPCGSFDETTIYDLAFHGTFVSALVSSNGLGMASVAPDATLMGVKVLSCDGTGSFGDIIAGIVYAADHGADVITMSFGVYFPKNAIGGGPLVAVMNRAANYANQRGVLVVASAGNEGVDLDRDRNFTHLPSMAANVVSVGATAPVGQADFDALASYTNHGVSGVTVMAPGGDLVAGGVLEDLVLSACSSFVCGAPNVYGFGGGTSFAAPHAAGTAAVIIGDNWGSPSQTEHCLIKGADDLGKKGTDNLYSKGRINVLGALSAPGGC